MRIAVMGTGVVGRTIAAGLAALGHEVVVGTRDPGATRERTEPDRFGTAFAMWLSEHPDIGLGTFGQAASHGELIVNATSGIASIPALSSAGMQNLVGKVLIDIANTIEFTHGMPPRVLASPDESLAERIQHAFPTARVVKTLNTMGAGLMVDPGLVAGGDHTVFISGNDAIAKAQVVELLEASAGATSSTLATCRPRAGRSCCCQSGSR